MSTDTRTIRGTDQATLDALVRLARAGEDSDWAFRQLVKLLVEAETGMPEDDEPYDFCEQPT